MTNNINQSRDKNTLLSTVIKNNRKTHLHQPTPLLACADTGSSKILIRASDAAKAQIPVVDAPQPLNVQFPDGVIAQSTGTATVALPATSITLAAHVFPDEVLTQSLFGIMDITDQGYEVTFKTDGVGIYDNRGAEIHFQPKLPADHSWKLPIGPTTLDTPDVNHALAVVSLPSDNDFVKFMHATFGSPSVSTFLRALRLQWLDTIPRLTSTIVSANRPNAIATALGHLDQSRQGYDSTSTIKPPRPQVPLTPLSDDVDPEESDDESDQASRQQELTPEPLLCKLHSTCDVDASGRFPVASVSKNEYILLSYFKGYVHAEPLSNRHHTSYIDAYKLTHEHWKQYGPIPTIFRLDNETSAPLEAYIQTFADFKFFPSGNHRANRAERAMRTWKNHFIATLATASPQFPMRHWDKLIPLAEITLNCLLPWHPNPSISAYHGLTGAKFDFRAHPIGPAGTAIVIHDKPSARGTWQVHGTPGFYLGPALHHYRSHRCLSSHTGMERNSDTVAWFPEKVPPPTPLSPAELLHAAILDLRNYIQRYLKNDTVVRPTVTTLVNDIQDLALMYNPLVVEPALDMTRTIPPSETAQEKRVITDITSSVTNNSPKCARPIVNIQRPNALLQSLCPPTIPKPTPPLKQHRTRSVTMAEHNELLPMSAYQALLAGDNGKISSSSPTFSDDSLHDYIYAWVLHTIPHSPNWTPSIDHLAPVNSASTNYADLSDQANNAQTASLNQNEDGTPLTYRTAKSGPNKDSWQLAEDTEISRLIDSKTMFPRHPHDQPSDRKKDTTYYNPQTKEKITNDEKVYRIRGTIGGDRINYTGSTKANTAALPVVKMLLQSVVSEDAEFMTIDIKDFYLNTALPRSEWMRIPLKFLSTTVIEKYNLQPFIHNGAILFEVVKSLYGLPHAGKIAQDELITHLAKHGYHQTNTTCLFRHATNGNTFTLIVDDFGIKYSNPESANHLIACLRERYPITLQWAATKYLGLTLRFDPIKRLVGLSIPGHIDKILKRFPPPPHGANSPAIYIPPKYGLTTQAPHIDSSPALPSAEVTEIQGICGALLYYCIAVDPTGYPAVTALASEQSKPTQNTRASADRLLAYFQKYPNNELILKACKMRLHQQADGSYLSRSGSRSIAGGISYLSNDDPTEINGAIHVMSSVIPTVMSSIGETEYAACFLTGQHGAGFRQVLDDLGYPQPPTYILTDNKCAEGIANNTIKPKRTKSLEMQYHWLRDRVARKQFIVEWRPGVHNLADFFTKPLPVHTHQAYMELLVQIPATATALCAKASRALASRYYKLHTAQETRVC